MDGASSLLATAGLVALYSLAAEFSVNPFKFSIKVAGSYVLSSDQKRSPLQQALDRLLQDQRFSMAMKYGGRTQAELFRRWQCWMLVVVPLYLYLIIKCFQECNSVLIVTAGIVVAGELVDFLSGLLHIYLDKAPLCHDQSLLDFAKITFHMHHALPVNQWKYDAYDPLFESLIAMPQLAIALASQVAFVTWGWDGSILLRAFLVTVMLWGIHGNMCHYYAHASNHGLPVPAVVAMLQGMRLLLTAEAHRPHHENTNQDFCIVTGHMNFLVNMLYRYAAIPVLGTALTPEENAEMDKMISVKYVGVY